MRIYQILKLNLKYKKLKEIGPDIMYVPTKYNLHVEL